MADADAAADTASGSTDAPAGPRSGEVANGETSNPHDCVPCTFQMDYSKPLSDEAVKNCILAFGPCTLPAKPRLSTNGESPQTS